MDGHYILQWDPRELEVVAAEFMGLVHPMVSGSSRDQDYIINMDQSPIPFTFNRQRTLELAGSRTVHINKSTCDTKWATLAITITASGKKITPILVFKVVPGGRIATWDFATYPCGCIYACQKSTWMDEVVMLQWEEQVLKPYILEALARVVPLLLLDS